VVAVYVHVPRSARGRRKQVFMAFCFLPCNLLSQQRDKLRRHDHGPAQVRKLSDQRVIFLYREEQGLSLPPAGALDLDQFGGVKL
jgi:hypothetical protein